MNTAELSLNLTETATNVVAESEAAMADSAAVTADVVDALAVLNTVATVGADMETAAAETAAVVQAAATTAETVAAKVRLPAAEQMARRHRVSFGAAFIRDVLAGTQRDVTKQVHLAVALNMGTEQDLMQVAPADLIKQLAAKIQEVQAAGGELPKNVKF